MENWDDYRYFLSVAKNGNYSAAARELKVSQPTVARHIADLEMRLDAQLFENTGNGVILTEDGSKVVEHASTIEILASELRNKPYKRVSQSKGSINVTTSQTLAEHWLVEKMEEFHKLYPEILVNILVSNTKLDIERSEADVALRFGRPSKADLIGARISSVEAGIYGSAAYFDKFGIPETLDDLKNQKHIGALGNLGNFPQIREFEKYTDSANMTVATDCSKAYIKLATLGHGLITVPAYAIQNSDTLKRVLVAEFSHPLEIWVLARPTQIKTVRIRNFIDFVKLEMKRGFCTKNGLGSKLKKALPSPS